MRELKTLWWKMLLCIKIGLPPHYAFKSVTTDIDTLFAGGNRYYDNTRIKLTYKELKLLAVEILLAEKRFTGYSGIKLFSEAYKSLTAATYNDIYLFHISKQQGYALIDFFRRGSMLPKVNYSDLFEAVYCGKETINRNGNWTGK